MLLRNKKSNASIKILLDIIGFVLVIGGSILVRYSNEEAISIVGGILVSIGIGLLSLSRMI